MKPLPWKNPQRVALLEKALAERILIVDGAMGTMIQRHALDEAGYRGERFAHGFDGLQFVPGTEEADHQHGAGCGCVGGDLRGNNDLLTLTRPDIIRDIHRGYLEAGADLIETNTFNSTRVSQADYGLQALAAELNLAGARLAREVADAVTARDPSRPRFVAGILGPTSQTTSISPDVNNPGYRSISFDQLVEEYREATAALVEGGVDLILIETVFDTLNCKAAIFAVRRYFDEQQFALPIMISGTITDASGRTLSGQTPAAFWHSVAHAEPIAIGFNCALGASELRPHIAELARIADVPVSAHPNAGLPNEFGEYDETPEQMMAVVEEFLMRRSGASSASIRERV